MAKPPVPTLEFLTYGEIAVAVPRVIGATSAGERRIVDITGGRFDGPGLSGDILAGGADWQRVQPDGAASLHARYTIRTDDGARVYIENSGLRNGPKDVLAAMMSGAIVEPSRYYFRAVPRIECAHPRYAPLMQRILLCSGALTKDRVAVDLYIVN